MQHTVKEQLAFADYALERLEVAFAQENYGHITGLKVVEAIGHIKHLDMKVTYEDSKGEHDVTLHAALTELNNRLVAFFNFQIEANDAMKAHDRGEETEFDPFRMELELDQDRDCLAEAFDTLRLAFDQLKETTVWTP
tara:strand:- start:180173 stop:180586 length:414 start_codon:yes stop_codon:yes gene_type:complete